jgi:hypothetical protein
MQTSVVGRKSFTVLLPLMNPLHHSHFKLRQILAKASIYFAVLSKEQRWMTIFIKALSFLLGNCQHSD